jgi:hypothetical protein
MEIEIQTRKKKRAESFEHLKIKRHFMKNIPHDNDIITIKEEVQIGDRIADIYCELTNKKKVVIEVQHSMILVKNLLQRTKDYNDHGCHVLWVFNGNSFYRYPKNEKWIRILDFEKACHELYRGRVYYINMIESGAHSPVYPLHYTIYHESKVLPIGFEYYRKSKTKKSAILGDLSSLKFKLFKNQGLKLAGFYDDDVRTKAIDEVNQFLKENESQLEDVKKKEDFLYLILGRFGMLYGVDLLHDILKFRLSYKINGEDLHSMKKFFDYITKYES